MTQSSPRYTAALSSLLLAMSFWLPTAASLNTGSGPSRYASAQHLVIAPATSPIVLM